MNRKPRLLIFIQWFTPGYKAGGPTRAIQNFVDLFADVFEIFIVASDRDLGDAAPYPDILANKWNSKTNECSVIYLDPEHQNKTHIKTLVNDVKPDAIYINSMYSYRFTVLPLLAAKSLRYSGKIILAPRGMLKASAMEFKKVKKKAYLLIARFMGLFKGIDFQATDQQEVLDIQAILHIRLTFIKLVNDPPHILENPSGIVKEQGKLKMAMIGRVHPIKGLDFLLNILKSIKANIQLDVIGWIEDKKYFGECEEIIKKLPSNVRVTIKGNLPFDDTMSVLNENHVMVLPTQGENFGHSIFEALSAGRPVIISDQTPWKNLEEKGIGWDIPLTHPKKFEEVIEKAAGMSQPEYNIMSAAAKNFAENYIKSTQLKEKYIDLFDSKREAVTE